jgi:hypothetical protein
MWLAQNGAVVAAPSDGAWMCVFVRGGDFVLGWHKSHFLTNEANKMLLYLQLQKWQSQFSVGAPAYVGHPGVLRMLG